MPQQNYDHGFPEPDWVEAKRQAMEILCKRAKRRDPITYSDFVQRITAVRMDAHSHRLRIMMGELSTAEREAGRPLITALIVHKDDLRPGQGFFQLARDLGYVVTDETAFWIDQLNQLKACRR